VVGKLCFFHGLQVVGAFGTHAGVADHARILIKM
jgi:hypothetical protein